MKKKHIIAAVGLASLVTLTGCGNGQQYRDLEGVAQTEPDKVRLVTNINTYPNIVALCIEGVGFITTTRDDRPLQESPGLTEGWCKS